MIGEVFANFNCHVPRIIRSGRCAGLPRTVIVAVAEHSELPPSMDAFAALVS